MDHHTFAFLCAAERERVFAELSNLARWPVWAPAFCSGLQSAGAYALAQTPGGRDYLALVADQRTGVVDLFIGPRPDELTLVPLRVVRHARGSLLTCTFLRSPAWSEEVHDRYAQALVDGLRQLTAALEGGARVDTPRAAGLFYPNLVTERFHETWDFYTAQLGFRTVCENEAYVHLVHPAGAQLGLLRAELDGPPVELISATAGRGFWLTLEVPDADAELARLRPCGVEVAEGIEDKPWGYRQFVVRDPNGVLIAIAHRTAAQTESLAALPAAS